LYYKLNKYFSIYSAEFEGNKSGVCTEYATHSLHGKRQQK